MIQYYFLEKYFINKNIKVLDLGCIGGTSLDYTQSKLHKYIKSKTSNVTGIDINKKQIKELKDPTIIFGNVENFTHNKKYDLIIVGNIIEHLTNINGFMKSIKKHSKKTTKILLFTPNAYSIINFIGILFRGKRRICKEHYSWYSLETLQHLIFSYNFKIIKYSFVQVPLNGNILNIIALLISRVVGIIRPAFKETIFIEFQIK